MEFEHILKDCGTNIKSMEQLHETLREYWALPSQSMDELAERLDHVMPGGYPVSDRDQAERQERRALTGRLQEKMTRVAERFYEATTSEHTVMGSAVPRHLGAIVLDTVADDPEEYRRRCAILQGNDPQAKAELTMEAIHSLAPLFQEVRETPLNHLTDEQIVDHFETIYVVNQTINQLGGVLGDEGLSLTPEQRNEILQLEDEFANPVGGAYTRAKAISNPCYELFPAQRFQNLEVQELDAMSEAFDDQPQFQAYLRDFLIPDKTLVSTGLLSEIVRSGLNGHAPENVFWMDETGEEIQLNPSTHVPDEEKTFMAGKPLIAQFPDGQYKVFFSSRDSNNHGIIEGDAQPVAERFKQQAAVVVKEPAKNLLNELKEADPWYINSSKEFKAMRSSMEAMEKACQSLENPPTTRQLMELRELSQKLERTSEAYLEYKGPQGKNETERNRIKAARNIQKFAKQQSARLKMVFDSDPRLELEGQWIKAEDRLQQEEITRKKFEALDSFLFDKQPRRAEKKQTGAPSMSPYALSEDILGYNPYEEAEFWADYQDDAENRIKLVDDRYPVQPNRPTSALNDLRNQIMRSVNVMNWTERQEVFAEHAKQAMVLMTAYDLIAQERNGRETPGPMEQLCQKSIKAFVSAVGKNQEVKKC